jgi:hypothetical protein
VEKYYNFAGFPGNFHSLSQLKIYRRDIIRVDDLGLHLIWNESPVSTHFIMPLPGVYANNDGTPKWKWAELTPHSRALIYSYSKLIQSQLDFSIAIENSLLDEPFTRDGGWQNWQHFIEYARQNYQNMPTSVESRFRFGDLRLNRLNWIFWFTYLGSHYYHTRAPILSFWHGYGKWVIIGFAYVSTMLTAMQVAIAASIFPTWLTLVFKWVSYMVVCFIVLQIPFVFFFFFCLGIIRIFGWLRKK